MARQKVEDVVAGLVSPIVDRNSFELVDIEFVKEGANWYLRVFIDKPGGITLDDCQLVSEELSDLLDSADPIKQNYMLEVSSPGLERPLKTDRDFVKYAGQIVEVRFFEPINGKKSIEGELVGLIDNKIVVKEADSVSHYDKAIVAVVRRVVKF